MFKENWHSGKNVILDGRDICTYVFPNADVKIYLDADLETRVARRFKQNQEKGINTTYEEVKENVIARDHNDKNKEIGSLMMAEDSVLLDNTGMTVEETVDKVVEIIKEKTCKEE